MAQVFSEWFQGISRSRADSKGFPNLVNCDIHSEIGYVMPQLALGVDGLSNTPTEACIFTKTPAGTVYAFSTTTGKIWKYSGSWSVVTANANTAHCGAKYYNGYLYYATSTKLGRFVAETDGSRSDTWQTFSNTSSYRPMEEVNLTLYIGNGKDIASVNSSSTYSNSALDLPTNYTVSSLIGAGVDLLVGTIIGTTVNNCKAFLWDTFSDSWTIDDEIPEVGINCFIKNDDIIFAQCGTQGQLYYWSGSAMVRFRKIPNITTSVNPYATTRLSGRCLFASGQKVFSIHREDNDLPYAIVQEYTTTSGNITSLSTYGTILLVSAGTHVDKTGTDYAVATVDTPEVAGSIQKIYAYYDALPTGTSMGISHQIDQAGSYTAVVVKKDAIRKTYYFDGSLGTVNFIQARITMTSNGTNRPKLRSIEL